MLAHGRESVSASVFREQRQAGFFSILLYDGYEEQLTTICLPQFGGGAA